MIQRFALLAGGLGAAAILAFALGLTNFVFAGPGVTKQTADSQPDAAQVGNTVVAAPDQSSANNAGKGSAAQQPTKKVIDKVYIAPTPPPKTIRQLATTPKTPVSPQANAPTKPAAPPAAPPAKTSWHEGGQESEHSGGNHNRQRGDD